MDLTELLGNCWGVGRSDIDNGLVLFVSQKMRASHIATGTGTENILTDSICAVTIQEQLIPQFKQGDFYQGIKGGVLRLMREWSAP